MRFLFLRERHIMQYGDKQSNGKVDEENIYIYGDRLDTGK